MILLLQVLGLLRGLFVGIRSFNTLFICSARFSDAWVVLSIEIIIRSAVLECHMISLRMSGLARFLLHQVVSTLEILVTAHVSRRIHGNTIEEVRKPSPRTKSVSVTMGS
jgi:hypothetical protein